MYILKFSGAYSTKREDKQEFDKTEKKNVF